MRNVHPFFASPSNDPGDRRIAERRNLLMKAAFNLDGSGQAQPTTIRDISSTGMKASIAHAPLVGGEVHVEIPGVGTVPATVVWAEDGKMGVHFDRVIDPTQAKIQITGSYSARAVEPEADVRKLL